MSRVPLAAVLVALAALPASASPPNAAAWSGTATVSSCGPDVCLAATSGKCVAYGGDQSSTACSVVLTGTFPGACAGVGSGELRLTDSNGDEHYTNATLVAAGGTVTFVARYAFLFDRTAVVATGAVDGGCDGGTWYGVFGGRGL